MIEVIPTSNVEQLQTLVNLCDVLSVCLILSSPFFRPLSLFDCYITVKSIKFINFICLIYHHRRQRSVASSVQWEVQYWSKRTVDKLVIWPRSRYRSHHIVSRTYKNPGLQTTTTTTFIPRLCHVHTTFVLRLFVIINILCCLQSVRQKMDYKLNQVSR